MNYEKYLTADGGFIVANKTNIIEYLSINIRPLSLTTTYHEQTKYLLLLNYHLEKTKAI